MSVNGITFDGLHSYNDFGLWLAERPDKGSPEPKLNTVEISGADGIIDLTEANAGEVKFTNRAMKFLFSAMVDVPDQAAFEAQIMNALHGKVFKRIILDEDPDWYYNGRVGVTFKNIKPWKLQCEITVDAAPYAMAIDNTLVDLNPSNPSIEITDDEVATDDGSYRRGSNFAFGTMQFPDGINYADATKLDIHIAPRTILVGNVSVYDAQGVTTFVMSTLQTDPYTLTLTLNDLDQAQVDLDTVYRITVDYARGATITIDRRSRYIDVDNDRKTVVPLFDLDSDSDMRIEINGVEHTIPQGKNYLAGIALPQGTSRIRLLTWTEDPEMLTVRNFTMTFRKGRL